jgi:hypothetical protein
LLGTRLVEPQLAGGLDSSARTELGDPHQIVSSADQVGGETGPRHAAIAGAAEVADGLDPSEDLLDSLADALADGVSRPAGGTNRCIGG